MAKIKPLAKMSPADRAKRIAALVSNPGTRAAVPDEYLPAQYRQQRQMNQRLNAPVTQGSSLTNRDLSRSASSQVAVKYGDAERLANQGVGQSQQAAKDTAGFYDEYLKQLGQHQANIQGIGQNAVTGVQALSNAQPAPDTTGLSGDNARDANNAAGVRKALLASFGAQLTAQGANANTYADTLAHVVGPGQKLTAQAQAQGETKKAQDALASLVKEKGSFRDQVMSQGLADEQKNVLAHQALGLDITKAATDAAAGRATRRETRRSNKASETAAANDPSKKKTQAELDFFNQHHYWPPTGPPKPPKGDSPYLPQASQNAFKDQFDAAKALVVKHKGHYTRAELAKMLQNGRPAMTIYVDKDGNQVADAATAKKLNGHPVKVPAIPKASSQDALTAALDAVYLGRFAPATVKKLHGRKIKVNPLGVSTRRPSQAEIVSGSAISSVGTQLGRLPGGTG